MLYFILRLVGCIKSFYFCCLYGHCLLPLVFFYSDLRESRVTWRLPHFTCHTLFTDTCIFFVQSRIYFFCPGSSC